MIFTGFVICNLCKKIQLVSDFLHRDLLEIPQSSYLPKISQNGHKHSIIWHIMCDFVILRFLQDLCFAISAKKCV